MKQVLSLIFVLLLSSCSQIPQQKLDGKFGGNIRLTNRGADPKTLNPWIASDATSSNFGGKLFEGLVKHDPNTDETIPHLAETLEFKDGGKTIIAKLHQDIEWSDGEELTADDVVYTWNTLIRDGVAISSLQDILKVEGKFPQVTKLDKYTIRFHTDIVFAPFLQSLVIEIAPQHDIENYFKENGAKSFEEKQKLFNNYLNVHTEPSKIVSSGPFKLNKIIHGERIEYIRNPKFFLFDENGRRFPYADKLTYNFVQDSSADIFKFLAGESYALSVTPINASFIKGLEQKYDFKLYDNGPSGGTNFIWFNMSKNIDEPKYSWFNDSRFRKAISYALDRENMVNNVFQGLGTPLFTAESVKSPFVHKEISQGHERDLSYALKLLEESEFKLSEKNGQKVLLDKDGNAVEFNLFTNAGNPEREFMSVIAAENLKEIGIKVNFKLLEFNNFVGRINECKNYEAGIIGFTGGNEPHDGANVWKTDGRLHAFDIKAVQDDPITRPWEKEIDKLFMQGVQHLDREERRKYYDRFQEIVYRENPMIYLVSPNSFTAVSNKLGGVGKTKYGGVMPYLYKLYLKS